MGSSVPPSSPTSSRPFTPSATAYEASKTPLAVANPAGLDAFLQNLSQWYVN
jgi:hypothetical protein